MGTLQLLDNASLASTTINVNYSGTLLLDNTGTINNNTRVPTSATVNMSGGTLNLSGQPLSGTAETIGTISLLSGQNTITSTANTQGLTALTINNLTRTFGATANFNTSNTNAGGPGIGNSQVVINQVGGVAAADNQVLPVWAIVGSSDYGIIRVNGNNTEANGVLPFNVAGSRTYQTMNVNQANMPLVAGILASGNYSNLLASGTASTLLNSGINLTGALRIAGCLHQRHQFPQRHRRIAVAVGWLAPFQQCQQHDDRRDP